MKNLFYPQAYCRTSFEVFFFFFCLISGGLCVWQGPGGCQSWADCSEAAWVHRSWEVMGDRWQVKEAAGKDRGGWGVAWCITFVKCQGTDNDFPPGDSACSGLLSCSKDHWGLWVLESVCHFQPLLWRRNINRENQPKAVKIRRTSSHPPYISTKASPASHQVLDSHSVPSLIKGVFLSSFSPLLRHSSLLSSYRLLLFHPSSLFPSLWQGFTGTPAGLSLTITCFSPPPPPHTATSPLPW